MNAEYPDNIMLSVNIVCTALQKQVDPIVIPLEATKRDMFLAVSTRTNLSKHSFLLCLNPHRQNPDVISDDDDPHGFVVAWGVYDGSTIHLLANMFSGNIGAVWGQGISKREQTIRNYVFALSPTSVSRPSTFIQLIFLKLKSVPSGLKSL